MQFINDAFISSTEYYHQIFNGNSAVTMPGSRTRSSSVCNSLPFQYGSCHFEILFTMASHNPYVEMPGCKFPYVTPSSVTWQCLHHFAVCKNQVLFRLKSCMGRFGIPKQESPAIADKPARRESLPKNAPIRRAYNVIADNAGLSSFV